MPTYNSTRSSSVRVKGPNRFYTLYPGDNEFNFYLQSIPSGVTLKSHTPAVYPYVHLADITSFPSDDIAVYEYDTIIVVNKSDGVCTFYANGLDDNTMEIPSYGSLTIENKQDWGVITFASAGTGTVSVWGAKNG